MKLDTFKNTSPNATAKDAYGARLHDRGTGTTCYGATEVDAIDNLCKYVDRDQVNALLQKDDRQSVELNNIADAFNKFAAHTAAMFMLLLIGMMLAMSLATPDHVSGKVSDDRPVMEAK